MIDDQIVTYCSVHAKKKYFLKYSVYFRAVSGEISPKILRFLSEIYDKLAICDWASEKGPSGHTKFDQIFHICCIITLDMLKLHE